MQLNRDRSALRRGEVQAQSAAMGRLRGICGEKGWSYASVVEALS
jgi:hypothetical protein